MGSHLTNSIRTPNGERSIAGVLLKDGHCLLDAHQRLDLEHERVSESLVLCSFLHLTETLAVGYKDFSAGWPCSVRAVWPQRTDASRACCPSCQEERSSRLGDELY